MKDQDESLSFNVIVVDSRPLLEGKSFSSRQHDIPINWSRLTHLTHGVESLTINPGRALLKSLISQNLPCTYVLLPLLSTLLPRASLVLLGASALHSDGSLYSRAGTALIAMLAKEHRVPVVACVETYKFGEKVVLDAVACNELGEVGDLLEIPFGIVPGSSVRAGSGLGFGERDEDEEDFGRKKGGKGAEVVAVHLLYDLTPPSLITAVCTEVSRTTCSKATSLRRRALISTV